MFFRQQQVLLNAIGTSLQAGVTAELALQELVKVSKGSSLQLAQRAQRLVAAGRPLAESLETVKLLDRSMASVAKAAERSGDLPLALIEAAQELELRRKIAWQMLVPLAYPCCLILLGMVTSLGPIAVSEGVSGVLWGLVFRFVPLIAFASGSIWLFRSGRMSWPKLLSWTRVLPGVTSVHKAFGGARLCRVLGRCMRAGLPIQDALKSTAEAQLYPDQELAIKGAMRRIEAGAGLMEALRPLGVLPADTVIALASAELAGTLDVTLGEHADALYVEASNRLKVVIQVLTVALTVVIMGSVMMWIISKYLALLPGLGDMPPELQEIMR